MRLLVIAYKKQVPSTNGRNHETRGRLLEWPFGLPPGPERRFVLARTDDGDVFEAKVDGHSTRQRVDLCRGVYEVPLDAIEPEVFAELTADRGWLPRDKIKYSE